MKYTYYINLAEAKIGIRMSWLENIISGWTSFRHKKVNKLTQKLFE